MRAINANYGIVRSVSQDRSKITIGATRGGTFECHNEGFEIGQTVCFLLDALGRRVIKVLPKWVADLQLYFGSNPELQEALRTDAPEPEPEPVGYDDQEEEDDYEKYADDGRDEGPSIEEYIDSFGTMSGNNVEGGEVEDWPEYIE
jgi:hypothetical protein